MPLTEPGEIPAFLQALAHDPRMTIRRQGPLLKAGKCIVYWMQRAQRGLDNPALDLAIAIGNELSLPVIAFFSVIANYPHANLRHYAFLNQGLPDIEEDLARRNVAFVIRRPPSNSLEKFLAEVNAAMLIGDENHCREPERWRKVLAKRLDLPFWTVDADVIVPSSLFPKHQYMLHIMRPKLNAELPHYLKPQDNPKADHLWQRPQGFDSFPADHDITDGWKHLDRSVSPVDTFTGGTRAALQRLSHFVDHHLANYPPRRTRPQRLQRNRVGHRRSARPPLVRPPHLRNHPLYVARLHWKKVRLKALHPPGFTTRRITTLNQNKSNLYPRLVPNP